MKKLAVIAASTALVLSACGSDGETVDPTTTQETTAEETTAEETTDETTDEATDDATEEATDEATEDAEPTEDSSETGDNDGSEAAGGEFVSTDGAMSLTAPEGWYAFNEDTPENFILSIGDAEDNVNILVQALVPWDDVPETDFIKESLQNNIADSTVTLVDESDDQIDFTIDAPNFKGYIRYINLDGMTYELTLNAHRGEDPADYVDILDTAKAK